MIIDFFPINSVVHALVVQKGGVVDDDVVTIKEIHEQTSIIIVQSLYTGHVMMYNITCGAFLGMYAVEESEVKRIKRIIEMQREDK